LKKSYFIETFENVTIVKILTTPDDPTNIIVDLNIHLMSLHSVILADNMSPVWWDEPYFSSSIILLSKINKQKQVIAYLYFQFPSFGQLLQTKICLQGTR